MTVSVVKNTFLYDVAPDRVWALVTDFDALAKAYARYLRFDGLPKGRIFQGQEIDVMVSLFGRLPAQPYTMKVVLCDDAAMRFESAERGAGVKRWDHHLHLTPVGAGTRLTEEITIDAGLLTPLFQLWAAILYRGRHKPRQTMLTNGDF